MLVVKGAVIVGCAPTLYRFSVYSGTKRSELKIRISMTSWQLFTDVLDTSNFAEVNPCHEQFLVLLLFSSFFFAEDLIQFPLCCMNSLFRFAINY